VPANLQVLRWTFATKAQNDKSDRCFRNWFDSPAQPVFQMYVATSPLLPLEVKNENGREKLPAVS